MNSISFPIQFNGIGDRYIQFATLPYMVAFIDFMSEGCGEGHDHNVAIAYDGYTVHGSPMLVDHCFPRFVQERPTRWVAMPRKLLEELAPELPLNQDELGGCVWCGGTGVTHSSLDDGSECPWVVARHILDDD